MTDVQHLVDESSARRVIALLSGDDARDAPVRAALAHLPAESILTSDPDQATAAGEVAEVALWIFDAANQGVSAEQLAASLPAGRTLVLVDSGEVLEADPSTASPLLLARPFQERTLLILCEHLLREATIVTAATAPESRFEATFYLVMPWSRRTMPKNAGCGPAPKALTLSWIWRHVTRRASGRRMAGPNFLNEVRRTTESD